MQTIFPGHFPKASENTALSEYSFSRRITNWQPKRWKTYRQVQSKNTITGGKIKKGSVILKIKWTADISSLCLSISVAYGFCTLCESQWSSKCKSQEASSLYALKEFIKMTLSVDCSHSKAWMNRLYKYGVLMEACTAKCACNQIFPMWITRLGIFKGL